MEGHTYAYVIFYFSEHAGSNLSVGGGRHANAFRLEALSGN